MRKEKQKNRKAVPYNIPMVMACVLFCCTLVSMHFTGGLYARYTATDTSADGARAATFGQLELVQTVNGTEVGASNEIMVVPKVTIDRDVYLTFTGSETDTYIFVAVKPTNWSVYDKAGKTNAVYSVGTDILKTTVEDDWTYLTTSDGEYVYYIYLDSNNVWDKANGTQKYFMQDIEVSNFMPLGTVSTTVESAKMDFRAVVVQAGGFTGATPQQAALAAWNAVK